MENKIEEAYDKLIDAIDIDCMYDFVTVAEDLEKISKHVIDISLPIKEVYEVTTILHMFFGPIDSAECGRCKRWKMLDYIRESDKWKYQINIRDSKGRTPLMLAVENHHWYNCDTSAWILHHKEMNINAQDNEGNTALHLAYREKKMGWIFKFLNNKRTDLFIKNNRGMYPFEMTYICFREYISQMAKNFMRRDQEIEDYIKNTTNYQVTI